MTESEMIEYLTNHGYKVEQNPIVTYKVELTFAGYRGGSVDVEVDAPQGVDEDTILTQVFEDIDIYDLLEVSSVEDEGDGEFAVTLNFGGYLGYDSTYYVDADDEDEAIDFAMEEAKDDISVESFEEV